MSMCNLSRTFGVMCQTASRQAGVIGSASLVSGGGVELGGVRRRSQGLNKVVEQLKIPVPVSSYSIFIKEQKYPKGAVVKTLMPKFAEAWRGMTDEQKQVYETKAKNLRLAYEKKLESMTEEEYNLYDYERKKQKSDRIRRRTMKVVNKVKEDFNPPKKPSSAYFRYAQERYAAVGGVKGTGKTVTVLQRQFGEEWKGLSQDKKERYHNDYKVAVKEYHGAMKRFEAQMMKKGNIAALEIIRNGVPRKMSKLKSKDD